ncbi:MAG: type II secretion system F family protein [Longispora sp.]|nr:type II secretion system F family protein [Longispora sp. (in: high G+C Gram-positive bacteria)]
MPGKVAETHAPLSTWLVSVGAGAIVTLGIGHLWGMALGVPAAIGAYYAFRRLEPSATRRVRQRIDEDAPFSADLLAAVLRAGAPVSGAVNIVGRGLGGPWGERLSTVAAALRSGDPPAEAWARLDDTLQGRRIATAAVRSSESGAALSGALTRIADELRVERTLAAMTATQRVGVFIVLPLGLCFLPAFVLAGLVPVLIAQFASLHV